MPETVTHQGVVIDDQYANHDFSYATFVASGNAREPDPMSAVVGAARLDAVGRDLFPS
jgi:hypothetical protein